MNKKLLFVVLVIAAIATSACKKVEYPASLQGSWVYGDIITHVASEIQISSSSASKGIPAVIYYDSEPESVDNKILIDYDSDDGKGTFKPEKGANGLQGSFSVVNNESMEVTVLNVKSDGTTATLLNKAVYTKRN